MKPVSGKMSAEEVVRRISDLREVTRRLAMAGYAAGLHRHDPSRVHGLNQVSESAGRYRVGKKRAAKNIRRD